MTDDFERSRELYDRALSVLPGGVNSTVRAVTEPYPQFAAHGESGHIIDADGNRYIDWVMALGPLLYGHDLPEPVTAAIQSHASEGPIYGLPTEVEVDHAEFVCRHVPSVEMIRFVNSGTEATVSAVRLARGYTGRNKVVIMQGGYHGAQESTLVEGSAGDRRPSSAGVPEEFATHTLPVPFNDTEAVTEVFAEHGEEIACVLVEPVLANTGIVTPIEEYHETLRDLCDDSGALLVFDEVITGFRVGGLACAQGKFGVTPDVRRRERRLRARPRTGRPVASRPDGDRRRSGPRIHRCRHRRDVQAAVRSGRPCELRQPLRGGLCTARLLSALRHLSEDRYGRCTRRDRPLAAGLLGRDARPGRTALTEPVRIPVCYLCPHRRGR